MDDRESMVQHFRRMPAETFRHFITHEIRGLAPDVVEVLRLVMHERGVVNDPDAVIEIQQQGVPSEEFERMLLRFRQLPCPICGAIGGLLNGARINRGREAEFMAGCVACLKKELQTASKASVGRGIMGGVHGNLRAIKALEENAASLKELDSNVLTQALREFVWYNRGEFVHLRG